MSIRVYTYCDDTQLYMTCSAADAATSAAHCCSTIALYRRQRQPVDVLQRAENYCRQNAVYLAQCTSMASASHLCSADCQRRCRFRWFVPDDAMCTLVHVYVTIRVDYCNVCPPTHLHIRPWSVQWIPGPDTYHTTTGNAPLVDHGLHGWVRLLYGTPDSLLPTHGLLPTTGQHGGRYDPQPVTRSSEWVTVTLCCTASQQKSLVDSRQYYTLPHNWSLVFSKISTSLWHCMTRYIGCQCLGV